MYIAGNTDEAVLYRHKRDRFMYIRSAYVHKPTPQCDYFYGLNIEELNTRIFYHE